MNYQQLKEKLDNAYFSEESRKIINQILDKAIKDGKLVEKEKQKLGAIIQAEIDLAETELQAVKSTNKIMQDFAQKLEKTMEQTIEEVESSSKEFQASLK